MLRVTPPPDASRNRPAPVLLDTTEFKHISRMVTANEPVFPAVRLLFRSELANVIDRFAFLVKYAVDGFKLDVLLIFCIVVYRIGFGFDIT